VRADHDGQASDPTKEHNMRHLAVLALVLASLSMPAAAQQMPVPPPTISLTGHGEVTGAPDTAFVTSGVTTQGATAREALDANTAAMTQLIAALKGAGIADRDIQTSGFSVNPNYVYPSEPDRNGYTQPPRIVGYSVVNMVTVRVRRIETLGAVLDQSVTVGANTINGISFSVDDPSALYDAARKAAFADARDKAVLYAGAAGVSLGKITAINETPSYGQPQPFMMKAANADMAAAPPVPVQAGELTFAIDVSVSWVLGE
jgi:uncharacterized protein YggE